MNCCRCGGKRVVNVSGKVSDGFFAYMGEKEYEGYVPYDLGVGSGDYIKFSYCLSCGQMQGSFPIEETKLETSAVEETENVSEE